MSGDTGLTARPVAPEDLFKLRFLMGADFSPDGRRVVYALSTTYVELNADLCDLFVLDLGSGETVQLTPGDGYYSSPVFSPDGQSIGFLATQGGPMQVYVVPAEGGEIRQVTTLPTGVGVGPAWSPDGTRLAFTAGPQEAPRDPTKPYRVTRTIWRADQIGVVDDAIQDIYVVDAAGGEPTRLTHDSWMNAYPVWSADGHSIIFQGLSNPDSHAAGGWLRLVDLESGSVRDLAEVINVQGLRALPDGRFVYVEGVEPGQTLGTKGDLWVLDPRTGQRERRAAGLDVGAGGMFQSDMFGVELAMGRLAVDDDGSNAYAMITRGGRGQVYRFALSGPENWERVLDGERVCAPVAFAGDTLLFAGYTLTSPGDLYAWNTKTGTERRLTHCNDELLAELDLPSVQRLEIQSDDGTPVEGWFLTPTDAVAPYPTILAIHGGPHSGWGYIFNFDFLMFAGAGFGVLFVNQRGSTGYGTEFASVIYDNLGEFDQADLIAGVDHAVDVGLADADRLGVWGLSNGGTLTAQLIVWTDRFKAACPENGGYNMFSGYGTSDSGPWMGDVVFGGMPHEAPENYKRLSPVLNAHRCTTPTLLLHHEADYRCPTEQAEQFYTVLKVLGRTVEMVRFPYTAHLGSIVGPPSHRGAQNDAILDWMSRYVLGKEEA